MHGVEILKKNETKAVVQKCVEKEDRKKVRNLANDERKKAARYIDMKKRREMKSQKRTFHNSRLCERALQLFICEIKGAMTVEC